MAANDPFWQREPIAQMVTLRRLLGYVFFCSFLLNRCKLTMSFLESNCGSTRCTPNFHHRLPGWHSTHHPYSALHLWVQLPYCLYRPAGRAKCQGTWRKKRRSLGERTGDKHPAPDTCHCENLDNRVLMATLQSPLQHNRWSHYDAPPVLIFFSFVVVIYCK